MVISAPDPCLIDRSNPPDVAFSIIQTLETVLGSKETVQVESSVPVYFKYKERPGSVPPSAMVVE